MYIMYWNFEVFDKEVLKSFVSVWVCGGVWDVCGGVGGVCV